MPTWKKVIVSGSNISQLTNDSGYLTNATVPSKNGFATASFSGTNLLADSPSGSLNFASSSGAGLTISANAANDTLTFGLSSIPNTSLANNSIGGIALGGSFNALTAGTGLSGGTYNPNTAGTTFTVSGASTLNTNAVTKWTGTAFANTTITDNGSVITTTTPLNVGGAITASGAISSSAGLLGTTLTATSNATIGGTLSVTSTLVASTISASSGITGSLFGTSSWATNALTASNITPAITNNTDNRVLTATGGGTINGESNLTFNGTTLTVTGNTIITNDLTVQGTASFQQTTNLEVADRFILLASGSNTVGDGGIVVQQATQNVGEVFAWDNPSLRWGVTSSFTANQSTYTPDAFMALVVSGSGTAPTSVATRYSASGNLFIGTDESIWIYS